MGPCEQAPYDPRLHRLLSSTKPLFPPAQPVVHNQVKSRFASRQACSYLCSSSGEMRKISVTYAMGTACHWLFANTLHGDACAGWMLYLHYPHQHFIDVVSSGWIRRFRHACLITVIVVTCNFFSEFCQRRIATGCGGARRSPATGMRTPGASAWQGGMRTPVTQLSRPRGLESATN